MKSAVVAGHLCLDILPDLSHLSSGQFAYLFKPGHLITVGSPVFSTGGAVSNTGLALHRLGIPVKLMARIGDDILAAVVRDLIGRQSLLLLEGIIGDRSAVTSYTLIIDPSGADRIFLHCPGANDTFSADDVDYDLAGKADLFHFGYPPLMRRMYQDGGRELLKMMTHLHSLGVTTSLDVSLPDPASESGQSNWKAILNQTLPQVDIFLPSLEELLFMLHRSEYDRFQLSNEKPESGLLSQLGEELLGMGVKIAVIKLGPYGLYVRTAGSDQINAMGKASPVDRTAWTDQELWSPCFQVQVAGTTGAGDTTIAGFLAALLRGLSLKKAVRMAVAAGACAVESVNKIDHLPAWTEIENRVNAGWQQHQLQIDSLEWFWDNDAGIWIGKKRAR